MPLVTSRRTATLYRTILALIGWTSIAATCGLLDARPSWNPLEMFTTQSNILCTTYFTVAAMRLRSGRDRTDSPFAPAWKGVSVMAVTVTLLVAALVLRMSIRFDTAADASLLGLHVIVPLMAIADPILFDRPGRLRLHDPWIWLSAPLLYLIEFAVVLGFGGSLGSGGGTAIPGGRASRAPYPFLDVDALGIPRVALNVGALAIAILLLGYLVVLVDHILARRHQAT